MCWSIGPVQVGQTFQVRETIALPQSWRMKGIPDNNIVIANYSPNSTVYSFDYKISSADRDLIQNCWQLDASAPKGTYQIQVQVGKTTFPVLSFRVAD